MDQPISRRIITPKDCLLSFGIPTSREEFFEAKQNPNNRDFAVNHYASWAKYYSDIVGPLDLVEPAIRSIGVRTIHRLTLSEFRRLLFEDRVRVLIVFSHWSDESVEFAEGLHKVSEVIESIPKDYSGILDLGICHPECLYLGVLSSREGCLLSYRNYYVSSNYR